MGAQMAIAAVLTAKGVDPQTARTIGKGVATVLGSETFRSGAKAVAGAGIDAAAASVNKNFGKHEQPATKSQKTSVAGTAAMAVGKIALNEGMKAIQSNKTRAYTADVAARSTTPLSALTAPASVAAEAVAYHMIKSKVGGALDMVGKIASAFNEA
jgi:hypothetical protein